MRNVASVILSAATEGSDVFGKDLSFRFCKHAPSRSFALKKTL
jgi:hypothetical protein